MVTITVNKGDAEVNGEGSYAEVIAEFTIAVHAIIDTAGKHIHSAKDAKAFRTALLAMISDISTKKEEVL